MKHIPGMGPLFTDLYELTMAEGFFRQQATSTATFSLFVRNGDKTRGYYVAAGLEDALHELQSLRFSSEDLRYLAQTGLFSNAFLSYLEKFRFTCSVHAMPEGTLFFPNEPILEVTGPVIEAQMVETFLLNTIGFQTLIASKAARCVAAAKGRPLVDFSLRRTQGSDAGLKAARSSYLAGFSGTSNVLAGKRYGIPIYGTMAHSFVSAFDSEEEAFFAFADAFPKNSVFLIDTYDTVQGAKAAAKVGMEMKKIGSGLRGVRIDSGEMSVLSRRTRRILDEAGLPEVRIFASGGFDEWKVAEELRKGAKIDLFCVGTKMGVSADMPFLDIVYKMVRYGTRDIRKKSPGKANLGGEKQVFRLVDSRGRYRRDILGTREDDPKGAEPLLIKAMDQGELTAPLPGLDRIRSRFQENFACLPSRYKVLDAPPVYPVRVSFSLSARQSGI